MCLKVSMSSANGDRNVVKCPVFLVHYIIKKYAVNKEGEIILK